MSAFQTPVRTPVEYQLQETGSAHLQKSKQKMIYMFNSSQKKQSIASLNVQLSVDTSTKH